MRRFLECSFLFVLFGTPGFGHGGQFRGPGDSLTPGAGNPGVGATVSGVQAATLDRWELWWAYNREPYLPRHRLGLQRATTPGQGLLVGRASTPDPVSAAELGKALLPLVQPGLLAALDDRAPDVVDSAVISLGRVGTPGSEELSARLRPLLRSPHRSVREAALLATGLLREASGREILRAIVQDTKKGRHAVGLDKKVDTKLRALGALALGFDSDPSSTPLLRDLIHAKNTPEELSAACVLALGLLGGRDRGVVVLLEGMLRDARLDHRVRAQVPIALHRLPSADARTAVPALLALLAPRADAPVDVRQSATIALGCLLRPEDGEGVAALRRVAVKDVDVMVRRYAVIALGRIGERAEEVDPGMPPELLQQRAAYWQHTGRLLLEQLRGSTEGGRCFAALALGLMLRGPVAEVERDGLRETAERRLQEAFDRERRDANRGAFALALGLAGATASIPTLRTAATDDETDDDLQGHLLVSLALLGDHDSRETMRAAVRKEGTPVALRVEAIRALAVLGDGEFQGELIVAMRQADSLPAAAAAATGLGLVGDRRAAGPLLSLLRDSRQQDSRRAFAAVCLGLLAEPRVLPWNAPLAVDSNYLLRNQALREILSLL